MTRFLKRLAAFIVPVVIAIICLEYTLYRLPNGYNVKKRLVQKKADNIEVLILGNSHALRGINPAYITKRAFNLSYVSQPLYYDAALTYRYLPQMTHLKYVIISLSYSSLDYTLMDSPEHWRDYFYYQFYGFRYPEISRANPHLYSSILLYEAPSLYIWFQENYKLNYTHTLSDNGWMFTDTSINNHTDEAGKARVAKQLNTMHANRRKENVSILCNLIDTLQKRNIKVIFISTPMHSTYMKYTNPVYLHIWNKTIDSISALYNVPFFNSMTDSTYTDIDFVNCDHLNARGAKKYSITLNKKLFEKDTVRLRR